MSIPSPPCFNLWPILINSRLLIIFSMATTSWYITHFLSLSNIPQNTSSPPSPTPELVATYVKLPVPEVKSMV